MPEEGPATASLDRLESWYALRTQLIWAYDGPVTAFRSCRFPAVPTAAWLLRRGGVTLRFGSSVERYDAGTWVFPRGADGWQEFSEDAVILSIRFIAEWPTGQPLCDRSQSVASAAVKEAALTRVSERLARFARSAFARAGVELRQMPATAHNYFELQRLLYGWVEAYARTMQRCGVAFRSLGEIDPRVQEAVRVLEARGLTQGMGERELAAAVGLSISQLNRLFARDLGRTPADYWEDRRVRAASFALTESKQSVKSIAYELGFSSLPHFSTWVKKKLGASPRELRR